jgi:hypothetical protein
MSPVTGRDLVFPDDAPVELNYTLSLSTGISTDTLTIERTINNYNDLSADSIIALVVLPPSSELSDLKITGKTGSIKTDCLGPLENYIEPNTISYMLTVRADDETLAGFLEPGETLGLSYKILVPHGELTDFPLHAAIVYFPGETFYTVSDSIEIDDGIDEGLIENTETGNVPNQLSVSVSPNPFNSSVRLRFFGEGIKGRAVDFRVFDILGRSIYSEQMVAESDGGEIVWSPSSGTATGIYFYRLSVDNKRADGKLMLLK